MTTKTDKTDHLLTDPEQHAIEFRRLAIGLYFPAFLRVFGASMCGTYIPLYAAEMGASNAEIGLIAGASAAGLLTADLPAGMFVSRLGTRRSMVLGLLGMAGAFGLASQASGIALLGVLLFLAGFCMALVQISQLTILRHAMPDRMRGRGMSLIGGTVRLAGVIAPLAGGMLVEGAGYRSVFGCYSVLLVCSCVFFVSWGPRRQTTAMRGNGTMVGDMKRSLHENWRPLLPAGSILLVLSVLRASRNILLPLWGHEMGLSPSTIGLAISIGAAADTLFFPLGGLIADKKGRRWSLTGNMGFFSLGLIALSCLGTSLASLIGVAVLIGIGNGLGAGINMTVGTDLAPRGNGASRFLGLWRVITDTGGALGPFTVGGLSQCLALGPAATVIGLIGLGGVALMWKIMPEPSRLHTPSGDTITLETDGANHDTKTRKRPEHCAGSNHD